MANDLRHDDTTVLLLPPEKTGRDSPDGSWRLDFSDFTMPLEGHVDPPPCVPGVFSRSRSKQRKLANYYRTQEQLLKDFTEMESIHETGSLAGAPTEDELARLARSERTAINVSNFANLVLFATKVYASIASISMAVIASTFDSLLDLLSGFILWYTSHEMKTPNQYRYPVGKKKMQPMGIIIYASIMGTLGLEIMLESGRQLISKSELNSSKDVERWTTVIMTSVTVVKFVLTIYCRTFENEIVRAYAQDHMFDVVTNFVGLVTAVLAIRFYWWIDPVGAILIAVYTMTTWYKTVYRNIFLVIGKSAPPEYLTKLTYLVWNHHREIRHIDTVRAYSFGKEYFVEVDVVLRGDMRLSEAHDIGETLQEKLERLPDVDRAFVHVDFEYRHKPEHNGKASVH